MIKKLLCLLAVLLLSASWAQASSRGIMVKLKASEQAGAADAGRVQLYSNSYALVIGNDSYNNGWPPLSGAVHDADLIAQSLRSHGFDVTLKKNLNASALKAAFEEFFIIKGEDPKSRLFVWFAGHGHTMHGEGYLVPVDAPNPNVAEMRFKLKALSLRNFGTYVRSANAKHAFSVFDSCFSGTVFESQRALPPAAITQATTKPVRQFLTSGDANQKVSDNGSFRKLFIRALDGSGRADANGDGYLTASELGLFMTDRVTNLTHARQTPKYGKLNDLKWDQGDFVFQLPRAAQTARHTAIPAASLAGGTSQSTLDLAFWNAIKNSADPALFNAYLAQFPNGTFASLARIKGSPQVAMAGKAKQVASELSEPPEPGKYRFTIHATPSNARIRILNIKPKYAAGMQLAPGRYHVAVNQSGYDSKQLWVTLGEADLSKSISLTKVESLNTPTRSLGRRTIAGIEMSIIPEGRFRMGSNHGDNDEKPVHTVHINSFKMGKYEVTQSQWQAVMGRNPSRFKRANRPVENVSWDDIQVYLRKLNSATGQHFRLPTEAEWEYAARAGSSTKYSWGNSIGSNRANCSSCGSQWDNSKTAPVGSFSPNGFGLYDMHGNVWEWVQDVYYYGYNGAPSDGSAWEGSGSGSKRVLRGGSWFNGPSYMRSALRNWNTADNRYYSFGFRLVQD